jgi:aspartokinase
VESLRRDAAKVVALVLRSGDSEFRLDGDGGRGARHLGGRVLNALLDAQIRIRAFDAGQGSLRFLVADGDEEQVRLVLREIVNGTRVEVRHSPPLVAAVGDGIAADAAIRSRMLSCLSAAGARGDLVARPAGRSGLSCTVHPDDLIPALRGLHEHFFASHEGSQQG